MPKVYMTPEANLVEKKVLLFSLFVLFLMLAIGNSAFAQHEWKIKKTEWSQLDEQNYSEFVAKIGSLVEKRKCRTIDSCLKHVENPYRGNNPETLNVYADCSRLPYILRAYFAWKNGLPFSVSSGVRTRPTEGNDPKRDIRYTRFGNEVTSRYDVVTKVGAGYPDGVKMLNRVKDSVSSAHFRMNYTGNDEGALFADFYPVKINREGLRAGTILYDPNGHVTVVHRIAEDGRIFYFDSHPDNSITSGMYGTKFVRSNPGQGSGFKNFRPLKLVNATRNSEGYYIGGKVMGAKNSNIADYSAELFFGTEPNPSMDWKKSVFIVNGQTYGYYDFIRQRMALGDLKIDPVDEVKSLADDLCVSIQDRVAAVDEAVMANIHKKDHPSRLPANIYGTSGEWESFSTPSRDARLKTSFKELRDLVEKLYTDYTSGQHDINYSGGNIKADMLTAYLETAQACRIAYTNSRGSSVSLNLEDIRQRLWTISFDPYHCVEQRWGALTSQELSTCSQSDEKNEWYKREVWLRNQIERKYDARMDFSLGELTGPKPGVGEANPPDVNIVKYLSN